MNINENIITTETAAAAPQTEVQPATDEFSTDPGPASADPAPQARGALRWFYDRLSFSEAIRSSLFFQRRAGRQAKKTRPCSHNSIFIILKLSILETIENKFISLSQEPPFGHG